MKTCIRPCISDPGNLRFHNSHFPRGIENPGESQPCIILLCKVGGGPPRPAPTCLVNLRKATMQGRGGGCLRPRMLCGELA